MLGLFYKLGSPVRTFEADESPAYLFCVARMHTKTKQRLAADLVDLVEFEIMRFRLSEREIYRRPVGQGSG